MFCFVRLTTTGETVDVSTSDGANAFLEQPTGTDGFNFFSTDLKTANVIRKRERKKGKLNNADRQTLRDIYQKVFLVATVGEPELFREKVPKTELEAWLNHVVEILRQITKDRKWINTGNLLVHDSYLMTSIYGLFVHPLAVALVFDKIKVLETISYMISILEKPPSVDFANSVVDIVEFTYEGCRHRFDKKWKAEKTFKKLESTGILPHYLRCAAIEGSILATISSTVFNDLLTSPAYLQKRFTEGTPCGDTIRAIVQGAGEHSPCAPPILPYMNSVIQLSTAPLDGPADMFDGKTACTFCRKRFLEGDLKRCAKCKRAAYCSRECQSAHWRTHKKICEANMSRRDKKNAFASNHLVTNFIENDYVNIMFRMVEECDKAGALKIDEMVAELDVEPCPDGTIPLVKEPPEFQIVPIAKYLDGTRFNEPDSLFADRSFKDEKEFKKCNRRILAGLKQKQSSRKPAELLCVVSNGHVISFQTFGTNTSEKPGFSQEAVEAFRKVMRNKDFSLLWEIFTLESERVLILHKLGMEQEILPNFSSLEVSG